ncbi:MAG TPA: AraC family transcriptional regulator [Niabella sp.]|nr:AraC family transcriptional regulator [Niabella sp.]HOZ96699.1 AraC family transcriptional regulator [Niabella sp.]HQW14433.1 AraC family transcriptional regulator [Niabella sp.]HQX19848.1 AraC family transcriptional regulator [Niabella sp.]HQX40693.1 AraC family transcriptional regulator [Niabella sp.]
MFDNILREIIPLTESDCFTIFTRIKNGFDFPLHCHEELELNFIFNGKGALRRIGDHVSVIEDVELVLIGSNLPHVWENHKCEEKEIEEITIQFHKDFLDEKFLKRNQMFLMNRMIELSAKGILFSSDTVKKLLPRLRTLNQKQGFDSILELISILHELSVSTKMQTLSNTKYAMNELSYQGSRIQEVQTYLSLNFRRSITLTEVAKLVSMTEPSFCRFFKSKTGITFVDCLMELRLGHASRRLIDTSESVAEIAYHCGFNNISNFNRLFKKKKGCTPKEYRESYTNCGCRQYVY